MVMQDILRYLIKYPDAKDTIQGIVHWWLPRTPVERREIEVQKALEVLVARGWVTQRQITPFQQLYGLNKDKVEEINKFLGEFNNDTEESRE